MKPNEQTANSNPCYSYNNFPNDLYCLNANPQGSNQFLGNYPNYHHEQIMHHHHHQYFDENNYIPYIESNYAQPHEHQENPSAMQTNNDLYEFLPEEIFQLDQPIVKNEPVMQNVVQHQNGNAAASAAAVTSSSSAGAQFDTSLIQPSSSSSYNEALNQNFIDLCPGTSDIHNGSVSKYATAQGSYAEINNNLNYNGTSQNHSSSHMGYNAASQESASSSIRFHHAYESEKARKTSSASSYHQSGAQTQAAKRDNSNFYLFQQSPSYYLPEIYASSSTSKASNDVMMYRSMEKYNYIVNN
jgi:hypothetical protein